MSLGVHERRTLSRAADQLAASDPELASMLRVFNRLAQDEATPARQPPLARSADRVGTRCRRRLVAASRFGPHRRSIRRQRHEERVQQE
jgi:hypothetical protein